MARQGKKERVICQRKNGLWMAQAIIGINPETSTPQRRAFYGKDQREAVEKLSSIYKN